MLQIKIVLLRAKEDRFLTTQKVILGARNFIYDLLIADSTSNLEQNQSLKIKKWGKTTLLNMPF
jgi:hypothetical protein